MEGKITYKNSTKKKEIRNIIFSILGDKVVHGNPGPDIIDYSKYFSKSPSLHMYEIDPKTISNHLDIMWKGGYIFNYHPYSIVNAPFERDNIYDLDFCKNITSHIDCVIKFNGAFEVFTFSTRSQIKRCKMFTINTFFNIRGEKVLSNKDYYLNNYKFNLVKSNRSKYLIIGYAGADEGRGSPMITIANVKNML